MTEKEKLTIFETCKIGDDLLRFIDEESAPELYNMQILEAIGYDSILIALGLYEEYREWYWQMRIEEV